MNEMKEMDKVKYIGVKIGGLMVSGHVVNQFEVHLFIAMVIGTKEKYHMRMV